MDSFVDINSWKKLLNHLESTVDEGTLRELGQLLEHLPTNVAPRFRHDFNECINRSSQVLEKTFDNIDGSNQRLLICLLNLLESFGHFRLAQITYCNHTPDVNKKKWYDLEPLLPPAGTLGWKGILVHGLVIENRQLFQTCLRLLTQKLHFYAIISLIDRFRESKESIQVNGRRVAEKLVEKILDFAKDDEEMSGIDSFLFNLLMPFTEESQKVAIIEGIIDDRFKYPGMKQSRGLLRIDVLVDECIMGNSQLQEVLITKLLDNLKCNIIRRKRRHSVEASQEQVKFTLESMIEDIMRDPKPIEILANVDEIELSQKSLQTVYLSHWVKFLVHVMTGKTLTARSSINILSACSILLVTTSRMINQDLVVDICSLMARTVECTAQSKLEKLFKVFGPQYLIEFTKTLANKTDLLENFVTPVKVFYKFYLLRHMRYCAMRGNVNEAEKFSQFVSFVCDKSIGKQQSHLLEYVCITELSEFLESLKGRGGNKLVEVYVNCSRTCGRKLYRFIKHRPLVKPNDIEHEELHNNSNNSDHHDESRAIATDSLVCVLRIAIDRKEQDTLDNYSDLMLKLYNFVCSRVNELVERIKVGASVSCNPVDPHLPRLISLYVENETIIKPYLFFDLLEKMHETLTSKSLETHVDNVKSKKKVVYNEIKTKLEVLASRADQFDHIYQTIINKQYNSVIESTITPARGIQEDDTCCKKYLIHMKIVGEVSAVILRHCEPTTYRKIMNHVVDELDSCDPLDHPKVLYLFLILESLIQKETKETANVQLLAEFLPRISCSLIRISKSVELGPSVHSFTNPGTHKSSGSIQCCTYTNCIKIYTLIFTRYPPKTTNPLITDAMQISVCANLAQYAKYARLLRFFIQLASVISGLLKAICIGRKEEDTLRSSMPIYLSVFSLLIRSLIVASDRQKLELLPHSQMNGHSSENGPSDSNSLGKADDISKLFETQLECLARDVGRIMNNLSYLGTKLVDYSPHLISTYIKDTQRAACPDFIKKHLDEGIFRIFNLVDAHQRLRQEEVLGAGVQRKTSAGRASGSLFEMIHARLDQASREIFRNMHENYDKFHRYLGKC